VTRLAALLAIAILLCLLPALASAETWTGRVTKVSDGDTLYMEGQPVRIRLWGISAPEKGQPFADEATIALEWITKDKQLRCDYLYTERCREEPCRPVCRCYLPDGLDLGKLLVRLGRAKDYDRYSRGYYAPEEAIARKERRGMWR